MARLDEGINESEKLVKGTTIDGFDSKFLKLLEEAKIPGSKMYELIYTTPFIQIDGDKIAGNNVEYRSHN